MIYERSLNRRRGGPVWPPACSTPQNVSPSLRRGGACPSRRISEMVVVRRRGESQTRPSPVRGNGAVRRASDPAPPAMAGRNQARRVVAPYGRHGLRRAGGSGIRPYDGSGKIQQNRGAGGSGDPPLRWFRRITAERENGRGKPLPYGTVGKHSAPEDAQKTQHPAGLLRKRAWRGLITIKCIIMYDF